MHYKINDKHVNQTAAFQVRPDILRLVSHVLFTKCSGTCLYFCAVPGCTSDDRKKEYVYMQSVQFHAFFVEKEKSPTETRKWLELL